MRRAIIAVLAVAAVAAGAAGCSRESEERTSSDNRGIVARVDDWTLTRATVDELIRSLPEPQRRKYETPAGRADLADRFIAEELFFREAQREGLEDSKWVEEQLAEARRRILISAYHRDFVEKEAGPDEQEIRDHYEANKHRYSSLPVYRAQHIFSKNNPDQLIELKKRVEEKGENFTTLAHRYSEDDLTKDAGGDLGFFNAGGYMSGIGFSRILGDSIPAMEVGKVHGPIKWERGYSIVLLNAKGGGELKPLEEVREEIARELVSQRVEQVQGVIVERVSANYDTHNYLREELGKTQRSAEELFNFAQGTDNSEERIGFFREIVEKYPNDAYAPQALFMVGFVYSEELSDFVQARAAFTELIDRYPSSEVAETARWMIDHLGEDLPEFESIDKLNEQVREKSE
jgi:parvulin-like peptidyl-prolyl isomerase